MCQNDYICMSSFAGSYIITLGTIHIPSEIMIKQALCSACCCSLPFSSPISDRSSLMEGSSQPVALPGCHDMRRTMAATGRRLCRNCRHSDLPHSYPLSVHDSKNK